MLSASLKNDTYQATYEFEAFDDLMGWTINGTYEVTTPAHKDSSVEIKSKIIAPLSLSQTNIFTVGMLFPYQDQ